MFAFVQQLFLKGFGGDYTVEEQISKQFATHLNQPNKQALLRVHISGLGSYALSLCYASVLLKHGQSNFDDVIKSFMVLITIAFSLAEALSLTPEIVKGSDALGSVFSIIKRKTTIDPDDPKVTEVTDIKGDIEFKNVSFKYPTRHEVMFLKVLNLMVPAGRSQWIRKEHISFPCHEIL
ncbi:ABC transporter B family member 14 [Bienertia sinuspersici]